MRHMNLDSIHRAFEAFFSGDTETLRAQWTPEVIWHAPGQHHLSGTYHGPDEILGYFGRLLEFTGGTHRVELEHALADDNMGYALYTERGERAGRSYESSVVVVMRFQGGLMAEVWDHPRDQALENQIFAADPEHFYHVSRATRQPCRRDRMRTRSTVRALGCALLFAAAGCGSVRSYQIVPVPYSARVDLQRSELTVEQEAWLDELCPFGAPNVGEFYDREPLTLLVREGYAILHNDRTKTPVWVCERVRHEDVHGPLTGRDGWAADPDLCTLQARCERGAVNSDYVRSGYDRGHLAPNWNQRRDEQRKRETFYFSNAAPQVGREFNQSVWQAFERELTTWTEELKDFWTITGVLFYDEKEEDPETAEGFLQVETIGAGSVFVPTHFYKIVVWRKGEGLNGFAVVMANRSYGSHESFRDEQHLRAIRWLEERLAVDFMPELEPVDADALEVRIGGPLR